MLVTPFTYRQFQKIEQDSRTAGDHQYQPVVGWRSTPRELQLRQAMLLVHQTGSVKIGEVVR